MPLVALVLELLQLAIRGVFAIDAYFQWVPHLATTVAGTTGVIGNGHYADHFLFIVFTFGSILIAIRGRQRARLTPRIIATTLLRDNTIQSDGRAVRLHPSLRGGNERADRYRDLPYFVTT